ncbi:MAG: tetratricopeptide repeat protein [Vicinamibacterales bacterium]
MAKQRRASSRSGQSKPADASVSTDSRMLDRGRASQSAQTAVVTPIPSTRHVEAVALYEEGLAALQAHDFSRASALLRSMLARYPEERALHERVRLYLNVCERHMAPQAASPSTPEERVFAATLAVNSGNYDQALELLRAAASEAPEHDHALYMLASVLALRDEIEEAVPFLLRAIDINPDNRARARHDPDLDAMREIDSVRAALEATSHRKAERNKAPRRR